MVYITSVETRAPNAKGIEMDASVLRNELQAMTDDGRVDGLVIDGMSGKGLARVTNCAGTTRHQFECKDGQLVFRGVSRRFTISV